MAPNKDQLAFVPIFPGILARGIAAAKLGLAEESGSRTH
jgi:hypothetical protein